VPNRTKRIPFVFSDECRRACPAHHALTHRCVLRPLSCECDVFSDRFPVRLCCKGDIRYDSIGGTMCVRAQRRRIWGRSSRTYSITYKIQDWSGNLYNGDGLFTRQVEVRDLADVVFVAPSRRCCGLNAMLSKHHGDEDPTYGYQAGRNWPALHPESDPGIS
jgi:hypothetical protein